jgi:C-methyltransferase
MTNLAQPPEALVALQQMINGKWVSKAISVAAELRIADVLRAGPRSCAEIARETGATEGGVYRLLRALSVVGVFSELEGRRFELTPIGEYLRTDRPESLNGWARFQGHDVTWRAWGRLDDGVRTGGPVFRRAFGMTAFEYLDRNPEAAEVFNAAMTSISSTEAEAIARGYDFSGISKLCDVAGGHGLLLATILSANPRLRGVLYEMPHAIEGARRLFAERGLASRCEVVSGDFFASVSGGCDAYIFKHIIHDWDDQRSVAMLSNCRKAMTPDGRLLVIEMVVPGPNEAHFGKLLDLEMMAMTEQGRERTREEFADVFRQAGFELTRVIPTQGPISIVEGRPSA